MDILTIPARVAKLSHICSKRDWRPGLDKIHLTKSYAEATDGSVLIRINFSILERDSLEKQKVESMLIEFLSQPKTRSRSEKYVDDSLYFVKIDPNKNRSPFLNSDYTKEIMVDVNRCCIVELSQVPPGCAFNKDVEETMKMISSRNHISDTILNLNLLKKIFRAVGTTPNRASPMGFATTQQPLEAMFLHNRVENIEGAISPIDHGGVQICLMPMRSSGE